MTTRHISVTVTVVEETAAKPSRVASRRAKPSRAASAKPSRAASRRTAELIRLGKLTAGELKALYWSNPTDEIRQALNKRYQVSGR